MSDGTENPGLGGPNDVPDDAGDAGHADNPCAEVAIDLDPLAAVNEAAALRALALLYPGKPELDAAIATAERCQMCVGSYSTSAAETESLCECHAVPECRMNALVRGLMGRLTRVKAARVRRLAAYMAALNPEDYS